MLSDSLRDIVDSQFRVSKTVLTEKQSKVLKYVKLFSLKHGSAPSMSQISGALKISLSSTHRYYRELILKEVIQISENKPKSIVIPAFILANESEQSKSMFSFIGKITADKNFQCKLLESKKKLIELPIPIEIESCEKKNYFVLKVACDSFTDIGYMVNDYLLIKKTLFRDPDEYVLVKTIKKNNYFIKKVSEITQDREIIGLICLSFHPNPQ